MLNPGRIHSNPINETSFSSQMLRDETPLRNNYNNEPEFGLSKVRGKLKIHTKLLDNDQKDHLEMRFHKKRQNFSVACSPTYDLGHNTNDRSSPDLDSKRTLESGGPSIRSDKCKLPTLSQRNNRRRARY